MAAVEATDGDADARRDAELDVVRIRSVARVVRSAERLHDALGGEDGVFRAVDAFKQRRELIAAQSCDRIAGTEATPQAAARLDQHLIAGSMPQGIVDLLEPIEVEEQDRHGCAAPCGR